MNKAINKTLFSFLLSTLLLFLFLTPISLKASEFQVTFSEESKNISSMGNKEIKKEITSCLMNNSFYPVLTDDELTFEVEFAFELSDTAYAWGTLLQGKNRLGTLFSIEKGWFWNSTNLLYMTTDMPPPSPDLFKKFCSAIEVFLPKDLSNYHVLIRESENTSDEDNQLWVFYNSDEWIEVTVETDPTRRWSN